MDQRVLAQFIDQNVIYFIQVQGLSYRHGQVVDSGKLNHALGQRPVGGFVHPRILHGYGGKIRNRSQQLLIPLAETPALLALGSGKHAKCHAAQFEGDKEQGFYQIVCLDLNLFAPRFARCAYRFAGT